MPRSKKRKRREIDIVSSTNEHASATETPSKRPRLEPEPEADLQNTPSTVLDSSPVRRGPKPKGYVSNHDHRHRQLEERGLLPPVQEAAPSKEELRRAAQSEAAQQKRLELGERASELFNDMRKPKDQGGYEFKSLWQYFNALFDSQDSHTKSAVTRFCRSHAKDIFARVRSRAKEEVNDVALEILMPQIQREGKALKTLFGKEWFRSVGDILDEFSMDKLQEEVRQTAPTIWQLLEKMADRGKGKEKEGTRDQSIIFVVICAQMAVLHSQRSSTFQTTMGLYLLAAGASKGLMEVLAHAGFSISYTSVINHVKKLSEEGLDKALKAFQDGMCSLIWDNLNIAFRVAEQRIGKMSHFDNWTTATLVEVFDPETFDPSKPEAIPRVPHGTLPLSMKPKMTSTKNIVPVNSSTTLPTSESLMQLTMASKWHLTQMAFDAVPELRRLKKVFTEQHPYPTITQIPVHRTTQYPLPAMNIEESSIDGTIQVNDELQRVLKISNAFIEKHGLIFSDGDLLTMQLGEKVESARRNSQTPSKRLDFLVRRFGLFHAKMAGGRMVANQHWGKPNSELAGGLCWENAKLQRKPMTAGWKGKKATPWKPAHELIQISMLAHIRDALRLHCGRSNDEFSQWSNSATLAEVVQTSDRVYEELFTTKAVDEARALPEEERDHTFENSVLYNRDALIYLVYVDAIKRGDIGAVVNVLRLWMVMMRGVGVMPKYADAIFETLARIDSFPPKLRELFVHNWLVNLSGKIDGFKELDLLQEHQNFWAKIIYGAKGSNKTWRWLAMITVCIYILRDAIRTVQTAFRSNARGLRHSIPDRTKDVITLSKFLQDEDIQKHVPGRSTNSVVTPIKDLVHHGIKNTNTAKAFSKFQADDRIVSYVEQEDVTAEGSTEESEDSIDDEESLTDDESLPNKTTTTTTGPSFEDLAEDDEEDYELTMDILKAAVEMVEDIEDGVQVGEDETA